MSFGAPSRNPPNTQPIERVPDCVPGRINARITGRVVGRVVGRPGLMDRPPLPSGHPVSWGAITQGTVLDQAAYPYPVWGQTCLASPPPRLPGLWYIS